MRRIVRALVVVTLLSAAALAAYAWLAKEEAGDPSARVVSVERGEVVEKAVAVGQIEPRNKFRVKSKISGIVARCFVEIGEGVERGDPLFEIVPDPTPIELVEAERQLESAEAALARAESELGRAEQLVAEGILARDERDAAFERREQARIARDRARDALALLEKGRVARGAGELESIIRAPAGGILLTRPVNPGDPIVPLTSYQAGTEMATIANMDDLLFKGTVDEIDVGKLVEGMDARLQIGALPEAEVRGTLRRIAPEATERDGARLFEVELEIDERGDALLRAGYSATASVIVRERADVLVVPERLVRFSEEGARAFVLLEPELPDGEPREVEVTTGLSDGLTIEILEGLEEGARLVEREAPAIAG